MAIEFDFAAHLKGVSAVFHLTGDRITPDRLKQTPGMPTSLVYVLTGGQGYHHSTGVCGLTRADIEITCHASTYAKGRELYDVIRDAVNGYRGSWNGTPIERCIVSEPRSASAPPTQADQIGFPGIRADIEVHYQQAIPTLGTT
jgi:hypothetical protein